MEKEVLNLREAAKLLNVSEGALRQAAERGEAPGRRIAGQWRFGREALHRWLAGDGPTRKREHPLARFAGIFKDDPVFEQVLAHIEATAEQQRQQAIREAQALERPRRARARGQRRNRSEAA